MNKKQKITLAQKIQQAFSAHQAGKLPQAEALYKEILAIDPNHIDANHFYGLLAHQVGRSDIAVELISKALSKNPKSPQALNNIGMAYQTLGQTDKAISCYKKTLECNPKHARALNNLGVVYQELGKHEEALSFCLEANRIDSGQPQTLNNIGKLYKHLGQKEKAIEFIKQALKIKPDFALAYENLSALVTYYDYDDDIQKMEALFNSDNTSASEKVYLGFALGKAFQEIKEYEKSFNYTHQANKLKRGSFNYDVNRNITMMDDIKKLFTTEFLDQFSDASVSGASPVFIVGMPRSGTTLTEQILASHSMVEGGGEMTYLIHLLRDHAKAANIEFPKSLLGIHTDVLKTLGHSYLEKTQERFPNANRITDKMPANFLFIGLIKIIFPNAKIIHCKRDPMASCYSIYKNNFHTTTATGMKYAYNLKELGLYCRSYLKLMKHWNKACPEFVYDLEYEKLVSDHETESRKLIEFCNLQWEDKCLEFYRTKRGVATASNVQVRQPIYKSSVQLWKNFEKELLPLKQAIYGEL